MGNSCVQIYEEIVAVARKRIYDMPAMVYSSEAGKQFSVNYSGDQNPELDDLIKKEYKRNRFRLVSVVGNKHYFRHKGTKSKGGITAITQFHNVVESEDKHE